MAITRRIFISAPRDQGLDDSQRDLKQGLVEEIEKLGYNVEGYGVNSRLAPGLQWHADVVDSVMRRCVGAVILGLPLRVSERESEEHYSASEHAQYEGAVAYTLGLPILVLAEKGQGFHGVFGQRFKYQVVLLPQGAGRAWLASNEFQNSINWFEDLVRQRRDIFLGYCSRSAGTADNIKGFIEHDVGATVLDWAADFRPGGMILEEIQKAADRCSAGIFLFTRDDNPDGEQGQAAPRDNVVFEAGFFAHAKGKERVLIVRENGSKMPADLGGDIYATLEDKSNIKAIKVPLRKFLEERL